MLRRTARLQTSLLTTTPSNRHLPNSSRQARICGDVPSTSKRRALEASVRFTTMHENILRGSNACDGNAGIGRGTWTHSLKHAQFVYQYVGAVGATSTLLTIGSSTQASRANQL